MVYLDFSKAFDKIDHTALMTKLSLLGVSGSLLSWIRCFLSDRDQRVRVGCELSDPVKVVSGVPQGSVMGPILFLVYISDLGSDMLDKERIFKYVDDTKVLGNINDEDDVSKFQEDLQNIYDWADPNYMAWNQVKFHLLRLGPNNDLKSDTLLFTGDYCNVIEEDM